MLFWNYVNYNNFIENRHTVSMKNRDEKAPLPMSVMSISSYRPPEKMNLRQNGRKKGWSFLCFWFGNSSLNHILRKKTNAWSGCFEMEIATQHSAITGEWNHSCKRGSIFFAQVRVTLLFVNKGGKLRFLQGDLYFGFHVKLI